MASLVLSSPSPRIFTCCWVRTKPCARSSSGVTVSPAGKTFKSCTLITSKVVPNGLRKPRLGMRRCSGIWPPSNPRRREYPRRDFWPLFPLPAVRPSLEPIPRPTRTLRWREPRGGRRVSRLTELRVSFFALLAVRFDFFLTIFLAIKLFHHFHKMPHLEDHAASLRRILALDHLIQPAQAQPANGLTHIIGAADKADHPFDLDRAA